MEHGFAWIQLVPVLSSLPSHFATSLVVVAGIVVFAWRARRGQDAAADPEVPDGRATARDALEMITTFIADLAEGMIGHEGRKYTPFFASFFVYILFANLIGLIPGFAPPTGSLNTTFGLGVVSFVAYNYYGLRAHGAGYLKQFMGPLVWLAPLMVLIELFSHVFRPVSLALRLFGNMFADHLVLGIFTDLTKIVVPAAFYLLGAFVCVVQAFVFTVLSMVYVALAVSHEH